MREAVVIASSVYEVPELGKLISQASFNGRAAFFGSLLPIVVFLLIDSTSSFECFEGSSCCADEATSEDFTVDVVVSTL